MKINVRLFASFREAVGKSSIELDVPDGSSVVEIMDIVAVQYPKMANLTKVAVFALNQEYVSGDRVAHDGDEIVFIPPVSGGVQCSG